MAILLTILAAGPSLPVHALDQSAEQPAAATSRPVEWVGGSVSGPAIGMGSGSSSTHVDPIIEERSRGVGRSLLLAGIGAAAVIAVLSGVFALRHKRH